VKTNSYGEIELSEIEAFNALYTGKLVSLENVYIDFVDRFNQARRTNADRFPDLKSLPIPGPADSIELFDESNQCDWFMPNDYCPNLLEMLYSMCATSEQTNRVNQELDLFIQHGMLDVLFYCKYLVDTMKENNIVWGVGRGSCVASYVLYLIGIHKVDSIKYGLDINEFLK